jgi:SET domain-containing protein 6
MLTSVAHRFWSQEELAELKGSMVLNKIGKEEADEEFENTVKPFVEEHKAVFGNPADYTGELFHLCGSWVLSRSFHVDTKEDEEKEDEDSDDEEEEREECVLSLLFMLNTLTL